MAINGKPVIDATKPLQIHITVGDIKKGSVKDPGVCAAARACMREGLAKAARVHMDRTYLLIDDKWIRYHTPEALKNELVAFDRGGEFIPGDFILKPLCPSHRMRINGTCQGSNKKTQRRKVAKRPYTVTKGVRERGAVR